MPSPTSSLHSIPSVYSIDSGQTSSSSSTRPSLHYDQSPAFRSVKLLPYELREHCIIYFEEGLYVPALQQLISLLILGSSSPISTPALIPPPQHIALAGTLVVHPSFTTRAQSDDRLQASILALKYLRNLLSLVGPINGNLQDAFAFSTVETSSRRGVTRRRTTGDDLSPSKENPDHIDGELANAASIWNKALDYWHVVGWAFNCSVLHKRRWERWQHWLLFMIDALETDWALRARMHEEDKSIQPDPREASMAMRYLDSSNASARPERRILRAIFADGSSKSTGEFPEIWRNETKERKKDADTKKTEAKIDIEADQWGDYMQSSSSSSDLEDAPPPASALEPAPDTSITDNTTSLGEPDAVILRLRLLSLLSTVSVSLPHIFTPLLTLYDLYLEHIRPLALPMFFLLISPSSMQHFHLSAASSITQIILRSLITSSAPSPVTDDLTQETLERCYLPHPANTGSISDNAKVSLCVETLLRLLQKHCGLDWSQELQDAVEKGIVAREQKAKKAGKGKARGKSDGEGERMWLNGSAGRMRALMKLVRMEQEMGD
ncbi:MAG: hypothetical protein Q9220_002071 [cf. Caloplaca sp. 1 TL-2023]